MGVLVGRAHKVVALDEVEEGELSGKNDSHGERLHSSLDALEGSLGTWLYWKQCRQLWRWLYGDSTPGAMRAWTWRWSWWLREWFKNGDLILASVSGAK